MILTSDQKLQFCNQDIEVMNINPKDTLSIAFEQLGNDVFPVIGKSNILETDTVPAFPQFTVRFVTPK